MKPSNLITAIAAFTVCTFFSCKKESNQSRTELLTSAGWYLVKSDAYNTDTPYVNIPLEPCEKDNVYKFNKDETVSTTVGVRCDSVSTDETAHWAFWHDENIL